jgi:transcriptional regulator with XRE-family HTH domain
LSIKKEELRGCAMAGKEITEQYQPVANRLKMIRDDFGRADEFGRGAIGRVSQKDMSEKVGCSLPTWSEYESARALPAPKVLTALIELGYDANWILSGKGAMRISSGSDWTLDKMAMNTVIHVVWEEIEKSGAKLSAVGASGIITMAYGAYRKNEDVPALKEKVAELIELAMMGSQQ